MNVLCLRRSVTISCFGRIFLIDNGENPMPVAVPNLIGLGRTAAEAELDGLLLRHIAQFPFSATGDGSATAQSPAAGTMVGRYSIVTVAYPTPLGPLDDSPVEGPTISGNFEGTIKSVSVGGLGAAIDFAVPNIDGVPEDFQFGLYDDQPVPLIPRAVWMRRGAMLSLAQRAFADGTTVRLSVTDVVVDSIALIKP
jgi:PASTA domain